MKISSYQTANINSLRQALNISNLKRAMNQDAQSVDNIIKTMERSVTPHKGGSVDMKI